MTTIHATAIVDPKAELDPSVTVGPYAVIGPHVRIGAGTTVGPHAVIEGHTTIGRDNRIFQFASLGAMPQDKKYAGEPTELHIGDRNTIREFCTFNTGTVQDRAVTRVGDDNWIMAYVHIAHDCRVGNHCVLANSVNLAGHVHLGDWTVLGGYTGVHQYCKIGPHVMAGIASVVVKDVPPFLMISGNTARAFGLNLEGLKRRGFGERRLEALQRSYRSLYREGLTLDQARQRLEEQYQALEAEGENDCLADLRATLDFIAQSTRGIVRP